MPIQIGFKNETRAGFVNRCKPSFELHISCRHKQSTFLSCVKWLVDIRILAISCIMCGFFFLYISACCTVFFSYYYYYLFYLAIWVCVCVCVFWFCFYFWDHFIDFQVYGHVSITEYHALDRRIYTHYTRQLIHLHGDAMCTVLWDSWIKCEQ